MEMLHINISVSRFGDGVCIGGTTSTTNSHNTQNLINNDLSLDQLTAIAGGTAWPPDDRGCIDPEIIKYLKDILSKKRSKGGGVYSPPEQDGNQDLSANH